MIVYFVEAFLLDIVPLTYFASVHFAFGVKSKKSFIAKNNAKELTT